MDMETQATIPLDFVIWAAIVAGIISFSLSGEYKKNYGITVFGMTCGIVFFFCLAVFLLIFTPDLRMRFGVLLSLYQSLTLIGGGIGTLLLVVNATQIHRRTDAQDAHNKLVEKGHVQDRLKAAIEHLGTDNVIVRMAAFREFYYLARDNENLREDIFDILCDYLQHKTSDAEYPGRTGSPTPEIQKLLDILFKAQNGKYIFAEFAADLRNAVLNNANLKRSSMKGALFGSEIHGADFSHANLQKANFSELNLNKAILHHALLQQAILSGITLSREIQGLQCQGAKLENANLKGATLKFAKMQGANLHQADMQGANLYKAELQATCLLWTKFKYAALIQTKFHGAEMGAADFRAKELNSTEFQGADYQKANFGKHTPEIARIDRETGDKTILERCVFFGEIPLTEYKKTKDILVRYAGKGAVQRYENAFRSQLGRKKVRGLHYNDPEHLEIIEDLKDIAKYQDTND